jgi:hypothetical protein
VDWVEAAEHFLVLMAQQGLLILAAEAAVALIPLQSLAALVGRA